MEREAWERDRHRHRRFLQAYEEPVLDDSMLLGNFNDWTSDEEDDEDEANPAHEDEANPAHTTAN
jgi:hypothetical protein